MKKHIWEDADILETAGSFRVFSTSFSFLRHDTITVECKSSGAPKRCVRYAVPLTGCNSRSFQYPWVQPAHVLSPNPLVRSMSALRLNENSLLLLDAIVSFTMKTTQVQRTWSSDGTADAMENCHGVVTARKQCWKWG
jgi:hypothetical protein